MRNISFLIVSTIFLSGCVYHNEDELYPECDFPPSPGYEWNYDYSENYLAYPNFNPENGNEILFQRKPNSTTQNAELHKLNLTTGERELIYTGALISSSYWGKNDWILLNKTDYNIYKIKSNGDSLTQLTFTGNRLFPRWIEDYSKIICYGFEAGGIIMSSDGMALDSISYFDNSASSSNLNHFSLGHAESIAIFELGADTFKILSHLPHTEIGVVGSEIINDSEIIWSTNSSIYKTVIGTGQTTRIKQFCDHYFGYSFPSYSPQLNKVVWKKSQTTVVDSQNLYEEAVIVIMNPDGTDEEEIEIDF